MQNEINPGTNFIKGLSSAQKAEASEFLKKKNYIIPRKVSQLALYNAQVSIQTNLQVFVPKYPKGASKIGDYKIAGNTYKYDPSPQDAKLRFRYSRYNYLSLRFIMINIATSKMKMPIWCEDNRTDSDYCLLVIAILDIKFYNSIKTVPLVVKSMISSAQLNERQKIANDTAAAEEKVTRYYMDSLFLKTSIVNLTQQCQVTGKKIIDICQGYLDSNSHDAPGVAMAQYWIRSARKLLSLKTVLTPKELFQNMFTTNPDQFKFVKDMKLDAALITPPPLTEQDVSTQKLNELARVCKNLVRDTNISIGNRSFGLSKFPRDRLPAFGITESDEEKEINPKPIADSEDSEDAVEIPLAAEGYPNYSKENRDLISEVKKVLLTKKQFSTSLCLRMLGSLWYFNANKMKIVPLSEGDALGAPSIPKTVISDFLNDPQSEVFYYKPTPEPIILPKKGTFLPQSTTGIEISIGQNASAFQINMANVFTNPNPKRTIDNELTADTTQLKAIASDCCSSQFMYGFTEQLISWQRSSQMVFPNLNRLRNLIGQVFMRDFKDSISLAPSISSRLTSELGKKRVVAVADETVHNLLYKTTTISAIMRTAVSHGRSILFELARITRDNDQLYLTEIQSAQRLTEEILQLIERPDIESPAVWVSLEKKFNQLAAKEFNTYGTIGLVTKQAGEEQASNKSAAGGVPEIKLIMPLQRTSEAFEKIVLQMMAPKIPELLNHIDKNGLTNQICYNLTSGLTHLSMSWDLKLPPHTGLDLTSIVNFFMLLETVYNFSIYSRRSLKGAPEKASDTALLQELIIFYPAIVQLTGYDRLELTELADANLFRRSRELLSKVGGATLINSTHGNVPKILSIAAKACKQLVAPIPHEKMLRANWGMFSVESIASPDFLQTLNMFMEMDKSKAFRFLKEVDLNKYVDVLKTLSEKHSVELPTKPSLRLAYKITVNTVFTTGVANYGVLNTWLDLILGEEPENQPINIFS